MVKTALASTVFGSATIIMLCFGWYTVMGEGPKGTGEYWTAYKIDKLCQQTGNPNSWECYRAELHRKNALDLADWAMKCGLIGTIATVGLGIINRLEKNN
jgi:hypothetical protein